jgi:peptidoglycan hydrolase-like protein with peptidoglycan-binding domain
MFRANLALAFAALLMATPAFATRTHRATSHATTTKSVHTHSSHRSAPKPRRVRGQQSIEPDRVTEIQQALIRSGYLHKDADGQWDATTQAAMQKYQADQGWQTKLMPDSRALKKLGLGPDYSNAINAKTATFADPPPISTIPPATAAGFMQGSGVNR